MMPTAQPLPTTTVEAILAAIPHGRGLSPQMIEKLSRWLRRESDRAIQHFKPRLTMDDVRELDGACANLRAVIEKLQDRTVPPPLHTESANFKALEEWADLCLVFGFKLGPTEGRYWELIFALLGLYQFASASPKPTVKANNSTMRFLEQALSELANAVPTDFRKCFTSPEQGALRKQLQANPFNVPSVTRLLAVFDNRQ